MKITTKNPVYKIYSFPHYFFALQPTVDTSGKVVSKNPYFISLNRLMHNPHYTGREYTFFTFS